MIALPLGIRPSSHSTHDVAAWFIPGSDAMKWLNELAGWGVPLSNLDLYFMPRSIRDRGTSGLFVVRPAGPPPRPSRLAVPYVQIGRRLYVPADARLDPDFSDAELDEQLIGDLLILHPSAGLVGFRRSDQRRVSELLSRPSERHADWDRAHPGLPPHTRLFSIDPEIPEATVEDILRSGRDDIGSQPLRGLPEAPNEPGDSPAHRAGRQIQKKFAQIVHNLASKLAGKPKQPQPPRQSGAGSGGIRAFGSWLGRISARAAQWLARPGKPPAPKPVHTTLTPSGPTAASRLRDWAWQKLQRVTAAIEAARNRELHRLLHLFDSDPDEALRYAMPLDPPGGVPSGPPGGHLIRRDIDFELGRLSGTYPVDSWSLDWEMRQRLLQKYRELANREIRLGRYRRAAYVLAELLNDIAAAAAVLVQGKYFREAAVLFRNRLNQPLEAARCLERAGSWTEAVAIYESLSEFEMAGDLYTRLEMPAEAETAYRKAIAKLRRAGDDLAAAQMLENKLKAHDEALELLASTWPWSPQADQCLKARFSLLGRLARHHDARNLVASLRESPPTGQTAMLAQRLAAVARTYPDQAVRANAADATRVIAGRRLAGPATHDIEALVRAVVDLEPRDKLLSRDGERFRLQLLAPAKAPARIEGPRRREAALFLRKFGLRSDVTWQKAQSVGNIFWATGCGHRGLTIARVCWDGLSQHAHWETAADPDMTVLLAADPNAQFPTWVHTPFQPRRTIRLVATHTFPTRMFAGPPPWKNDNELVGVAYDQNSTTWCLLTSNYDLVLKAYRPDGTVTATHHVAMPIMAEPDEELAPGVTATIAEAHLLVQRDTVYIAAGNHLIAVHEGATRSVLFHERLTGLTGCSEFVRPRIAVTHERGGAVFWGGLAASEMQTFGDDLAHPVAAFTANGILIAASRGSGAIFDTNDRRLKHVGNFEAPPNEPVAILPCPSINRFAILLSNGDVWVYEIRR
jgi:tetratricopeptide (TPR) repeat protein